MITIHKFEVPITEEFELLLPEGYQILDVQTQRGTPQLWVLLDTEPPKFSRKFSVRGTGHRADGLGGGYIGTFQVPGNLVFHLFHGAA